MRKVYENQYGVEVAWMKKSEDWPGTQGITGKQGFWSYSPNQGERWTYLGPHVSQEWLREMFGENIL